MAVSRQLIIDALLHRYPAVQDIEPTLDRRELVDLLAGMDTGTRSESISEARHTTYPDACPAPEDMAVLMSVDDCFKLVTKLVDIEPDVRCKILSVIPRVAIELLEHPQLPLAGPSPSLLTILDLLIAACIGWAPDLGRAGENLLEEIDRVTTLLRRDSTEPEEIRADLESFLDRENRRIEKLEERLIASETGRLRSRKTRSTAAHLINETMADRKLTAPVIAFLQGPWYDSLQLLGLKHGLDGQEWIRARKMTETIILTFQPIQTGDDESRHMQEQQLYRIIENIPSEIRDLLVSLEHDANRTNEALSIIENEYVKVLSGEDLEYAGFTPLPADDESFTHRPAVSRVLMRRVDSLETGQWFTFGESSEDPDRKPAIRIKLILKLQDIQQLLFTNRNGMKALEKSFDELAYLLSAGVIRPLNYRDAFSSTFTTFYHGLITRLETDRRIAAEEEAEIQRVEASRLKALEEARALALAREEAERRRQEKKREQRLREAQEVASLEENQAKVEQVTETVRSLNIGAWLKLPDPGGKLEQCKLAVRLSSTDKMIFVSRTGQKIGEYTSEQLVQLLVAGQGVVEDTGVEFEDTLAAVVSRLRQDRNKSYDDLTGP